MCTPDARLPLSSLSQGLLHLLSSRLPGRHDRQPRPVGSRSALRLSGHPGQLLPLKGLALQPHGQRLSC